MDSLEPPFAAKCGGNAREAELNEKLVVLALVVLFWCSRAGAEGALAPKPEEVARAYVAARDVGNVEAAMAFFTTESVFQLTGGKRFTKDELQKLHEMFA